MDSLFTILAAFVAYLVYVIKNEPKPGFEAPVQAVQPKPVAGTTKPKAPAAPKKHAVPKTKATTPSVVATKAEAKVVSVAAGKLKPTAPPAVKPSQAGSFKGLKDPKTGEVVTSFKNYRFTKRWIKEALVAEKLLDKVYASEEMNPELEEKIKAAIVKLAAKKNYKA
jgi:hypothetical protein